MGAVAARNNMGLQIDSRAGEQNTTFGERNMRPDTCRPTY